MFRRILGGVDPDEGGGPGGPSLGTGFGDASRPTVPAPASAEVTGGVADSVFLGSAMDEVVSNCPDTFKEAISFFKKAVVSLN